MGIIRYYIENKCSKDSSETMLEAFNAKIKAKTNLAMAIIKSLAVSSGLKPAVEGCYSFEGDSPMILWA